MFDHLIMPPRAGYAVITTNDFMAIVRDTGDIVGVLEDADAVLEHLSLTLPGGLRRKRVYVESSPGASDFHEVMHEGGDLLDIVVCSAGQADYLQQHIAGLEGSPGNG
ncbi:hypothetical protein [Halomonas sp. HAL1]|uniref:hypothetical protein n=1 Tax=Halomonas sp. HAL1 TaxID=550984 RepID=UPI00022D2AFC|nr:hypothetical protein [Halomonas sp. HAL1]EHA15238.1 hypothetical protein HAL1_12004 [Halomonas sp. HAL1]WKV95096.1 hypothetical protein Q3Y66_20605 [Halomonas sp. HAL1]